MKGHTKNSIRGSKTIQHGFAIPNRTFFFNVGRSKLPAGTIFERPYIFAYRIKLTRQRGNFERFRTFKKAVEVPRIIRDQKILKKSFKLTI